jgi:hypothetical protein
MLEKPLLNLAISMLLSLIFPRMPLLSLPQADIQTHNSRKCTKLDKYWTAILDQPVLKIGVLLASPE